MNKMKKILYLTNIEVPYRVAFFNELSRYCDLTVVYERRQSQNRDSKWTNCCIGNYKTIFLDGRITIGRESSFSFQIINILKLKWDVVVIGCYNSIVQIFSIAIMRLLGIPYIINVDGEPFIGSGIKAKIKSQILKGAKAYLVAGSNACQSLKNIIGNSAIVIPYYFSSLSKEEIYNNCKFNCSRNKTVLVVGQYLEYKGMDIALDVAKMDKNIKYKFIGMGNRTNKFIEDSNEIPYNVEIIPFLQKEDLNQEYKYCGVLMLPTRQECWGLVINEAASFGMPIVSTWGSGAAIEFLAKDYPAYLAEPSNSKSLYKSLRLCLSNNNDGYSQYLKDKSKLYSIERNVEVYMSIINNL